MRSDMRTVFETARAWLQVQLCALRQDASALRVADQIAQSEGFEQAKNRTGTTPFSRVIGVRVDVQVSGEYHPPPLWRIEEWQEVRGRS